MRYIVELTAEQEKALLTDMLDISLWIGNAIHNKARQCIDEVCRQALEDNTDTILTKAEKQEIVASLAANGKVISTVKGLPETIKLDIVSKARVKSAAERQSEWEAKEKP